VVVKSDIDLDPLHLAAELARAVVGGQRGAELMADVAGLVGGEEERLGPANL
jgi:predicted DNA-binding protein (UPF0278 family)